MRSPTRTASCSEVDFSEAVVGLGPRRLHGVHGRRDRPGRGRGRRRCVLSGDRGRSGGRAFRRSNVTLSVNHSAVFDAAGNQMTSTGYQVQGYAMLDNTGLTVTSIQRQVDAGNDTGMFDYDGVTNSDQLVWTVNTSEPIAPGTLTGADFALTGITPTSTPTITWSRTQGLDMAPTTVSSRSPSAVAVLRRRIRRVSASRCRPVPRSRTSRATSRTRRPMTPPRTTKHIRSTTPRSGHRARPRPLTPVRPRATPPTRPS